eukprot:COSAG05_NODE_3807_length_1829_cov_8.721473_1_plen_338_part_00
MALQRERRRLAVLRAQLRSVVPTPTQTLTPTVAVDEAPNLDGFSPVYELDRIAAHYCRHGFCRVRSLLSAAEAEAVLAASRDLISYAPAQRSGSLDVQGRVCPAPGSYSFTDPVKADDSRTYLHAGQQFVLNRINAPLPMSETLRTMYGSPRLLSTVEAIYGADFVPFAESLVLKQPDSGAGFRFHQDALREEPFGTAQGEERGINVGIYLTPSTRSNGCLWSIPGSHAVGRVDIDNLPKAGASDIPRAAVPIEVGAGDAIIHSRTVVPPSPSASKPASRSIYTEPRGCFSSRRCRYTAAFLMRQQTRGSLSIAAFSRLTGCALCMSFANLLSLLTS